MRVVLDTNIFISAILGGGLGDIIGHWRVDRFMLVVSDEIVREYFDVLRRPKFGLSQDLVEAIIALVFRKVEFVTPVEEFDIVKANPKDNMFLESAVEGNVDWIVSGDKHLLDIGEFHGIRVVTGREFLDLLE